MKRLLKVPDWWPFHFGGYATFVTVVVTWGLGITVALCGLDDTTSTVVIVVGSVITWALSMYVFVIRRSA